MKVWVTKYALSRGILERDVEGCDWGDGTVVKAKCNAGKSATYFRKPHWHKTRAAALAQAKRMFADRRRLLQEQLQALDAVEGSLETP